VNRFYASTVALAWAASVYLGGAGEQRSLEQGGNTLRRLTQKPPELLQEYWPWIAGGVVVILLLRWYLRR
jgi:hypothetical protein